MGQGIEPVQGYEDPLEQPGQVVQMFDVSCFMAQQTEAFVSVGHGQQLRRHHNDGVPESHGQGRLDPRGRVESGHLSQMQLGLNGLKQLLHAPVSDRGQAPYEEAHTRQVNAQPQDEEDGTAQPDHTAHAGH